MERQLKKQNEPDQEHQKERSEAEKKEFEKKGKEEIEQLQSRWEHARAEIECSFHDAAIPTTRDRNDQVGGSGLFNFFFWLSVFLL